MTSLAKYIETKSNQENVSNQS